MKLRFSDGVDVDTSGELRTLQLHDGWYVVGEGLLSPVGSYEEALEEIVHLKRLKEER